MKASSSSNAALGTIFLLLAIGCGSSTGSSGSNESDGGAGTSANGTGGAGSTGAGGSGNETGGSAGSSSGPGGSAGAAGHEGTIMQDAGSQSDATLGPDVISGGGCPSAINIADCDARPGCHPVFVDPGTCGCAAPGCCAKYQRCAEGKKAKCTVPAGIGCTIPQPFCEAPYVISYTNICYDGCVRSTDCAQ